MMSLSKPSRRQFCLSLATTAALGAVGGCTVATGGAADNRRVALVIGNSAYRHVTPLDTPGNDAQLMAQTLQNLGFQLAGGGAQLDLARAALQGQIKAFEDKAASSEIALFYYSGHGLQVDGVNYLVPVNAKLRGLPDVDTELVDAGKALRAMQQPATTLKILVLDACRNNPFQGRGLRTPGLAEMRAPPGSIISYATQPGGVASDALAHGRDSPYTTALAEAIRAPGVEVVRAFNDVGLRVSRETNSAQDPWLAIAAIPGEFYLARRHAS
jgi:uncharacterized caspase-like protein